eukprot:4898840-Amphidinium_carterae.1
MYAVASEAAYAWCAAWQQTLGTSDMDCEVEVGLPLSSIILSLPTDIRRAVSTSALAAMGEGLLSRVMNGMPGMVPTRTTDALQKEVK